MLKYDRNDYTRRTIVKRECLCSTNIPFTEELSKCFNSQQQQYCLNETNKACNATKCAQNKRWQQLPLQMQQMEPSQLQSQLQPFKREDSLSPTYSCISPKFLHFLSVNQSQQQQNPSLHSKNPLNVMQNLVIHNDNSNWNCPNHAMDNTSPLPSPTFNNENTAIQKCCGDGNGADCRKKTLFKMSEHFFDSLTKIYKNLCLTDAEVCDVQENLWKLSQNPRAAINHNIEYMLEQNLLNDYSVTFLQSTLCTMESQSKLNRHFLRQFLHALRNAIDLVNNYFHPWALLSTNDPYEMAQFNGVLSMNVKEIYESPNKWLYIKKFLIMLSQSKSTADIVDYFLKRISKNVLSPQAIDVLEKIVSEKFLDLSNAELRNLQNALKECSKTLFRTDPILNKENVVKATIAPEVEDFQTAYRFSKVLSSLSLKQINDYLNLDDIKDVITEDKLKGIFNYVNQSAHCLNSKRLNDIVRLAKKADKYRYTINNKELKIAIKNSQSSDEQTKLTALDNLRKTLCVMPTPYLENVLNDLRKYKLLSCQQFIDIYNYMNEDKSKNKDAQIMANIERVKKALRDTLEVCQIFHDRDINKIAGKQLVDILQSTHPDDAANFAKDLEINHLNTPEDYHKLIVKLSYMPPNDAKRFCENLKLKEILPDSKNVIVQNRLDNDIKELQLPKTAPKQLKKLLQQLLGSEKKGVAILKDTSKKQDGQNKQQPVQENRQEIGQASGQTAGKEEKVMEATKKAEEKTLERRKNVPRPEKNVVIKDYLESKSLGKLRDKLPENLDKVQEKPKKTMKKDIVKNKEERTDEQPEISKEKKDDKRIPKKNEIEMSENDLTQEKRTKVADLTAMKPIIPDTNSSFPLTEDTRSRISVLLYRDVQKLKQLKDKQEMAIEEEIDPNDKRGLRRESLFLEKRYSGLSTENFRESMAWLPVEEEMPPAPPVKQFEGFKRVSRESRFGKYMTKLHFLDKDKGHETRRLFTHKRSAHTLMKDLPYLKAVIQVEKQPSKSLTHLMRKFPRSAPQLRQKPHTETSKRSERFLSPSDKQLRKYVSEMSVPSGHHLAHNIASATSRLSVTTPNFENSDDYIALLNKISTLDKRSTRQYIMDLYRKGVLSETKLRRLYDILKERELPTIPKSIRNSITNAVNNLLEDETFNSLLNQIKIEYVTPMYLQYYAEYKFRKPTPQRHPMNDIHYNRGLANWIDLVRRTVIDFWQDDKLDIKNSIQVQ